MTNLLPAGVAVHDEDPEMYEIAAEIFFDRFVESCNFYYRAHMHHQGTHYNGERFVHDIATSWFFQTLAGIRPDTQKPGFKNIILQPVPVKELSWGLGFADAAYFSQLFKKRFGILPTEVQPH